jgi:hypothetical protein
MKPLQVVLPGAAAALSVLLAIQPAARAADWTAGMKQGKAELKSMGPIAFGPEGILFIADTKAACVVAVATGETKAAPAASFKVEGLNRLIAGVLGTTADQILIADMAVHPVTHQPYLAVSRGRGPDAVPALVRMKADGQPELVSLDKVMFSRAELPDAPVDGVVGQGNRQSNPRRESITDIAFLEDRVLIAGLSNEEFASTLRAIPFPFKTVAAGTSAEIYHGSHGRFETRSPVRTFVPFKVGNEAQLLAAYTCTPLVQFPVSALKPGAKIKGKTIAELGNRNRPIDMIVYEKGGKDYLLLANSSRGVMKINTDQIERAGSIDSPVPDNEKRGLTYETIEGWKGVDHLDRLDASHAVVVRHSDAGALTLESLPLP